ncbi:U2 small nuclear ribonucleoprotein auxiliary factor 35 kDa subunit-related protein 2 [Anopheles maculipalpis]|uniref:U2 small nuclear ribonucleoprotein auxiliary factor 35 kDa subunit-related protein 2 n=1 Tax=Anopheles maculipalpis TaxID=1496333 RepID=UPI002158AE7F|nr:U2 small nuclear ribonucleoprotein auxiliary factor 35 kDa subunit-related protein 2 [Anopheles maculipalpis]
MNAMPEGKMRHREWRKLLKKRRRKAIRQKVAQEKERIEAAAEEARKLACPAYQQYLAEKEREEQIAAQREELERALQNAIWLEKEHKFQIRFQELRKNEEAKERKEQEKREKIRKEFEECESKIKQAKEEQLKQKELLRRMLHERHVKLQEFAATGAEEYLNELQSVHNTRIDAENCKFFLKTGACRHGYRCCGNHPTPGVSALLLIPNFFSHPALEQTVHAEYGQDARLEFDEDDLRNCFNEFFRDIIMEFEMFGKIKHIFVCRNSGPHLRGSAYIEYELLRNAAAAYLRMNGRFYAKKQLHVEFRNPIVWPMAVCGLFELKRCHKGAGCNFLHILKNPDHRYVYNHFQESRSMRKEELVHLATPLVEKSWDEITTNRGESTRKAAQWRWSESPEMEDEKSDPKKDEKRKQHNGRNSEHASERSSSTPKHNRSPSRIRSRNRARNRSRSGSRSQSRNRSRSQNGKNERLKVHNSKNRYDDDKNYNRNRKTARRSSSGSPSRLRSRTTKTNERRV